MATCCPLNQFKPFLSRLIVFAFLIIWTDLLFAQPKKTIPDGQLRYQFRDDNRWEGLKSKRMRQVAGALQLESLVLYPEGWRQPTIQDRTDSVSIFFHATALKDLEVTVFNLDVLYFMVPHPSKFSNAGKKNGGVFNLQEILVISFFTVDPDKFWNR